jgi:hypothetical protein
MTGIGLDNLIRKPETVAQVERPRLVRDERVGPPFEREAVESVCPEDAARPVFRLQNRERNRPTKLLGPFMNPVRSRETRKARSDHHDAIGFRCVNHSFHQLHDPPTWLFPIVILLAYLIADLLSRG